MKAFSEALADGFTHILEISDPELLKTLRDEGIQIDTEGYWSFSFGENKEYELCVEPLAEDGNFRMCLYKNRVLLTEPLIIWEKIK